MFRNVPNFCRNDELSWLFTNRFKCYQIPKLYIPSTLNIDLILWHTQLIVCAENVKSWFKSWVFPFTFQAYILPHTLNCMCHGLRTPREEIAFTARPKIQSQSQIFRYGRSIFCLPHRPNFSDIFDLCLHWVSVVRACMYY